MLMLVDWMMLKSYWLESMSRPPEMDQPKVRRLGVFKSAAMITLNQTLLFDQVFITLTEGLNFCICCISNAVHSFWFHILPMLLQYDDQKRVGPSFIL